MANTPVPFISIAEMAAWDHVSKDTLALKIRNGLFPGCIVMGGMVFIPQQAVYDHVARTLDLRDERRQQVDRADALINKQVAEQRKARADWHAHDNRADYDQRQAAFRASEDARKEHDRVAAGYEPLVEGTRGTRELRPPKVVRDRYRSGTIDVLGGLQVTPEPDPGEGAGIIPKTPPESRDASGLFDTSHDFPKEHQ